MRLEDIPEPEVGPEDVKIKVKYAGICHTDVFEYLYGPQTIFNPPLALGHEFSGIVEEEEVAEILYASGTTEEPKGTMLTRGNLFFHADAIIQVLELNDDDRALMVVPMFHGYGITVMLCCFVVGTSFVLLDPFNPVEVSEAVQKYRVTFLPMVVAMYFVLYHQPDREKYDLSSLRIGISGASAMPAQLMGAGDFLTLASSLEPGDEQPGGKRVAVVGGPAPQLEVFDLLQEYGLTVAWDDLCTASRYADGLAAGYMGFDDCVCSYARCIIASTERGEGPLGALPVPDLLLACNNGCGTMFKWFEVLSRRFGVPLLCLDTPYCAGEPTIQDRAYLVRQLDRMVSDLGDIPGKRPDREGVWETLKLPSDTARLWVEIQDLRRARPSPLNPPHMFLHMALIVTLRGTENAYNYYQDMLGQVRERVDNGVGAIENERYRLLWDHIPPWYALRDFFDFCAEQGSSYFPWRIVGWGRAAEICFTGDRIPAEEAYRIGLVNRLYEREKLLPQARAMAQNLLLKTTVALLLTKEVMNAGLNLASLEEANKMENRNQAFMMVMQLMQAQGGGSSSAR
jgi:hypothetical protein